MEQPLSPDLLRINAPKQSDTGDRGCFSLRVGAALLGLSVGASIALATAPDPEPGRAFCVDALTFDDLTGDCPWDP